jgi:hypothetical protein
MKVARATQSKLTLKIPAPVPALRFEDVNWPVIFEQEEFRMMGLCNRHVTIDNTGRDCYGLPLIVDAEAYPAQGSPYCMPFTRYDEKQLNELLWQLHILRQGEYGTTERMAYRWYLDECEPTATRPRREPLTQQQYFLQRVVRYVQAKVYPSPRLARHYLVQETSAQYEAREAAAEAQGGRYATNLERFAQLDFVGLVIFCLEGQIRHQRQEIYFARLLAQAEARQQLTQTEARRESRQRWYPIDQQREAQRLERLAQRRAGVQVETAEPVQFDLFKAAA